MKFLYKYCFILSCLFTNSVFAQVPAWPLDPDDDNLRDIYCTFSEIHPTNQDHIHGAIDIGAPNYTKFRSILNGRILELSSTRPVIGHLFENNNDITTVIRKVIYGDDAEFTNGLKVNSPVLRNIPIGKTGPNSINHLHIEMYVRDNSNAEWRRVDPLNNPETNFQLDPELNDVTPPQINNIILHPVSEPVGINSGLAIYTNSGGLYTEIENSIGFHIHDRPGNFLQEYNSQNDKVMVWGSVGSILNPRDVYVTLNAPIGPPGFGIYGAIFRVDQEEKYRITFDEIWDSERFNLNDFYHLAFNSADDEYYGTNDFLEMRRIGNENANYPHKLINGIQSNGVWATRAQIGTPTVFESTPILLARGNEEALYPDGNHMLSYTVSDAAGLHSDATVSVLVDNFAPYVKSVKMEVGGVTCYDKSWEWSSCGGIDFKTEIDKTYDKSELENTGMFVTINASEPLSEMKLKIPFYNINTALDYYSKSLDDKQFTFYIPPVSSYNINEPRILIITGKDYKYNPIINLETLIATPCVKVPIRSGLNTWLNPSGTGLNFPVNNGDRTHKLPCTTIIINPLFDVHDPTSCENGDGAICVKAENTSGGFPEYNYKWEDEMGSILLIDNSCITNLLPGKYWHIATDAVGCEGKESFDLNSPYYPIISYFEVHPSCSGVSVGLVEIGIVSEVQTKADFTWSNGSTTYDSYESSIENVPADHYCVEIKTLDGNCIVIKCKDVENISGAPPVIENMSVLQPCPYQNNGKITVSASTTLPPLLYDFGLGFNQNNIYSNIGNGTYTVSVKDYCLNTISQNVNLNSLNGYITTVPGCIVGNLTAHGVDGNPPYNYEWFTSPSVKNQILGSKHEGNYSVYIKDARGCHVSPNADLVNTYFHAFDEVKPCDGFNDGSFKIKVLDPFEEAGTLKVWDKSLLIGDFAIPTHESELIFDIGDLAGDKSYDIELNINGCIVEEPFELKSTPKDYTYVGAHNDICYAYEYCKGTIITPPGEYFQYPVNYDFLNANTHFNLLAGFICTAKGYCNGHEVGSKTLPLWTWRAAKYKAFLEQFIPIFGEAIENNLFTYVQNFDDCDFITFCPFNMDVFSHGPNWLESILSVFGGTEETELPNGCKYIACAGPNNNFYICPDDEYPNIVPVIHNIANCNTKLNRVYDLMRWQEELENNENGFAGSALDNFLTIHKGEPEVFCASIRYCKRDYTIQWTDFYYVNCQPVNTNCIPNTVENVYYEPCTIATDPNVWPFPSSPQIICDVNGCPQLHTPFPDYPRGYNFIDENNPNLIVTHITENQNDQEFMDFGFHRIENMISPKPIFRTGDHYELNDYVWNQKEIQTRKLDLPLKALYIEIDTFKAFILTELVPNKEYEFRQAVDTLNYILNIKSTGSLKIEKTFRQDKVTKIIGTFSGILKLDTTQISTYKENNIFYLDINDNGNVVQYHLIDNIRANSKIAITNRSNSIRIDGYAKSNVIILNGLTTTLTNPDSSFHLLVSENGISTNNANYIVQGTVSQIKNTSFNKKKSAAMVFKGQGRLFIGSAVFNLNGTKALFIEVDSTNSILWSKYVPIELIQENKFDIIFDSKGNLIAALTTNTNGQIDSLHIINGGGDDINFFIVDSTGDIFGAKRFCSSGMENIKKLFYDRGFIYFGGEFKNDSTFVFIGHNEYYNVSKNLQHAYTSFIIANDFESPQSNGSPQSPEKISQNNFLSLNNISIYPNPTSGEVAINLDLIKESNVKYLLIDINGIERDAGDFNNKFKNEIIVNKLKSLDAGIYFLKIYINDKLEKVEKLIKI